MNLQRKIHVAFPPLTDVPLYVDGIAAGMAEDDRMAPDSPDWREGYRRGQYLRERTVKRATRNMGTILVEEIGDGTVQLYRADGSPIGYAQRLIGVGE